MQNVLKIDFLQSNLLQSRTRDVIIIEYIEKVCTHAYARTHARREMNSTAYAKRTLYKPIDFFFRGVADTSGKTKKIAFVDAFQVLNDRYLGRMSVCNYFYIAEGSVRINELNIIALEELVNYDLVMKENFLIPDVTYNLPISTRFLENDKDFDVLTSAIKDLGYKKSGLIISFFVSSLTKLDDEGRARYNRLRKLGYKICATAFGEDYNSLDVFSDFTFDYLRCEAQYFGTDKNKKKVLAMQEALKPGDIVLTQSGLYGVLTSLENTTAHLRLTNGFEIVIDRFSIKEPAAPEAARAAQTVQ